MDWAHVLVNIKYQQYHLLIYTYATKESVIIILWHIVLCYDITIEGPGNALYCYRTVSVNTNTVKFMHTLAYLYGYVFVEEYEIDSLVTGIS